ncbi:MAG: methylglyoxal synthase [Gemmatimonadetes bacterium]|nr:methylglyoxal synthase [Gemmatimonadota bacterium]MBT7550429.1 methylglyoxal synthase [Gemmatimonadota bacterium]
MQNRRKDLIDILKEKSPLAGQLTDYEMLEIIRLMPLHAYRENATILTKGEPANSLMFLISGEVNVHLNEHRVAKLTQGDVFGEAMFSDQGIRIADAVAVEPTEVLLFDHSTYEYLLREDTKVALKCKLIFEQLYKKNSMANEYFFTKDPAKYLALVAHNEMKKSLVNFVQSHVKKINMFPLVATGTTGELLYKEAKVVLTKKVKSGPLGGDQAIGQMISNDNICGVIFFRDPLSAHPHHADIEALGRLCDVYQIPLATNPTTAVAVLNYLTDAEQYEPPLVNSLLDDYSQQQAQVVQGEITQSQDSP